MAMEGRRTGEPGMKCEMENVGHVSMVSNQWRE
jgi:hypothetical protein